MKFSDHKPIYQQIMDYIKAEIVAGRLSPGAKLPSVRELSMNLQVNPNTIQRSFRELESQGLIFIKRGMGTFVTEEEKLVKELEKDLARVLIGELVLSMKNMGFSRGEILELVSLELEEKDD